MSVGRRAVVGLGAAHHLGDAMLLAQHPVEMGEEALRPLLAGADEADGASLQGGEARRELADRRGLFGRGIENTESHGVPLLFLWRFAIDAGADRQRDGMTLVAEPWRDDGAEAAGRSAGGDDEELIGRFHRRIDAVAAVAHDRTLADLGPFAAMDARALVDEVGDVRLAPLCRLQVLAQLLG